MKKFLLLNSGLFLLLIHFACQSASRKSIKDDSTSKEFNDSITKNTSNLVANDTSQNSMKVDSNSLNPNQFQTNISANDLKSKKVNRIEHGSANDARLDSIKRAKAKQKL